MKHFIAIHRFHNDEKRKEYCMSPERKDPPEAKRTVKEWADFACNMSIELHEQWRFHSYYDQSEKELVYKDY